MRRRKRLVQVQMDHVDAHVARPRDADQRIHVGAVHVDQPAGVVNDLADLLDVSFKQSERVRIGQHQARDVAVRTEFAQVIEISQDLRRSNGWSLLKSRKDEPKPDWCRAPNRESASCGDCEACRAIARVDEGANDHDARHLAVRAGGRLQRNSWQARDLGEMLLQFVNHLQARLVRLRSSSSG